MSRLSVLSNPLLLGFEEIERLIDRTGKGGNEGYPPYNIERIGGSDGAREKLRITIALAGFTRDQLEILVDGGSDGAREKLRITIALAGFTRDQLEILVEDNQLTVRGRQQDDKSREYLYRGIATRQFTRTFVLADGIEVQSADLSNGLLAIDLVRHEPHRLVRKIEIGSASN